MNCPHLDNGRCEIASSIAYKDIFASPHKCAACQNDSRSQRINLVTISLANSARTLTPEEKIKLYKIVADDLPSGFGERLARIFKYLGIEDSPDCGCSGHKDILNLWTKDYIQTHREKVIRWLGNESRKRRLPFSPRLVRKFLSFLISLEKE